MITLFGQIFLILALIFALLQPVCTIWGKVRHNPYLLASTRPACLMQCACIICSYVLLTMAFVTDDFSIRYVAANSHATLPLLYKLTALWGAHEGSLLLWILILNLWTTSFCIFQKKTSFYVHVLTILSIINFCFVCFLLFTSNPFLATPLKIGQDLNPLLQDPGFVIHPPMLYSGYVGFSIAFAITQAALIRRQLNAEWALITRRFALVAWCFLTLGIALGSWWAYRMLGWGGFWFWDPVENASLLPWLSGIALIHILLLFEKRNIAQGWAVILAITTFGLSLLGTFLVRSGVLISVHSFANDPLRGIFLLLLFGIIMTVAFIVYALYIPKNNHFQPISWVSRETGLLLNSAILFVAMLTILLGTLYPLIIDALHLGNISVGSPYFNTVMIPILFLLMVLMGIGPQCQWQTQAFKRLWKKAWKRMLGSLFLATMLLWYFTASFDVISLIGLTLSFWMIASLIRPVYYSLGMTLAHIGFGVLIIGIIFSSMLKEEQEIRIQPGQTVSVGPYQFSFLDTQRADGSNYQGLRANFAIKKNQRLITHMHPEKRFYTVRETVMTKVAIHPGIFRDLYIALGDPLDHHYWSVRFYYKPFIRWIWLGGMLMVIGGLLTFKRSKNRYTPSV